MNKRHYEHTLPNIRGSLSNTYEWKRLSENIDTNISCVLKVGFSVIAGYRDKCSHGSFTSKVILFTL